MFAEGEIVDAHLHSKNGGIGEVEVLRDNGVNDMTVRVVETGIKCHAIFNSFVCMIYADDKYCRID